MPAVDEESKRRRKVQKCTENTEDLIRRLMKKRNMTQADCARLIGTSQSNYSYLLKNLKINTSDTIMLLVALEADPTDVANAMMKGW